MRREDLPNGAVRIHFAAPILDFDQPKGFVDIRPPTVGEYLDTGDPLTWVFGPDGGGMPVSDRTVLRRWASTLVSGHSLDVLARESSLALAMAIEEAILGFFKTARMQLNAASAPLPAQPASPTSSA